MKIESVRIQNFRAFADETITFDDYTCLVGPNGSGKSTILTTLNVFFREIANASTDLLNLGKEDFHKCNTSKPIKITVTKENWYSSELVEVSPNPVLAVLEAEKPAAAGRRK